jgi:hypothetical protein
LTTTPRFAEKCVLLRERSTICTDLIQILRVHREGCSIEEVPPAVGWSIDKTQIGRNERDGLNDLKIVRQRSRILTVQLGFLSSTVDA